MTIVHSENTVLEWNPYTLGGNNFGQIGDGTTTDRRKGYDDMDNLSIERVWEDSEFFEIEVTAQSKIITANMRSYTTEESIKNLASRLTNFPNNFNDRYIWKNGNKGDMSTPFVSLEFWCEDKRGHIIIEVYMELDDGASYDKHNCCFFIKTEIGLLNSFGKSLLLLNQKGTGKKVIKSIKRFIAYNKNENNQKKNSNNRNKYKPDRNIF